MTDTRKVAFSESRLIRRKGETVKWWAGQTYDYDPDMDPMIEIGHARFVEEPKAEPIVVEKREFEPDQIATTRPPNRAQRRSASVSQVN